MSELVLPNIPIKITRRGERIQLKCGDYQLELIELYEGSQTYSLLLLDKFVSEVAMKKLKEHIEKQDQRKAISESLKIDDAVITDNVIKQIHEDMFGGQ
jgi:hypothetical protein